MFTTHSMYLPLLKQRFGMKALLDVPIQKLWLDISMCFGCIIQSLFFIMLVSIISCINLHSYCMHCNLYYKQWLYLSFLWFVGILLQLPVLLASIWFCEEIQSKFKQVFFLCVMESVCICLVCHMWTNQALSYDFKIKLYYSKIIINLQHISRFVICCN
jgi:hypothetical protein